jgi:tetratricopeptide (TPR) repeat protein
MGTSRAQSMIGARAGFGIALMALVAGGCTSVRSAQSSLVALTPAALLPSPKTPAASLKRGVPTADELAAPHRTRAADLEAAGRLHQAVDAWTTALALAPDHEPSRQALRRLRERVDREVAEHMRRGWQALARENAAEARRHFVAALTLDPDSRIVQDAIRATAVPADVDAAALARVTAPAGTRIVHGTPSSGIRREEMRNPDALYSAARTHLAAGRDDDAYRALAHLDHSSPGYRDSAVLLRDLRARLISQRYQEGMRLFREERLEEAIEQWRGVLDVDAAHADARRNIEQAERMLRTLASQPKR